MRELPRVSTALLTPFRNTDTLDERALQANTEFQVMQGVGPLFAGTTGESPTIRDYEFSPAIRAVVQQTRGRVPVMVGTGSSCTYRTIKKTQAALEAGADIALVVMPHGNKPEPAGQLAHFRAAAEVMPIVLYDIKGRAGREIDYDVVKELSEHPNIIGYKAATHELYDADGNPLHVQSERVAEELSSETFRVWSGDDVRTLDLMENHNAYGVITVSGNAVPDMVQDMVEAAATGDYATAHVINERLTPFHRALFLESNPGPANAANNMLHRAGYEGRFAGVLRAPLSEPRKPTMIALREALIGLEFRI
tara:strand:- start:1710 stop:2636 length:927 start_codon:yes stop_codon:yes gene_type:complete